MSNIAFNNALSAAQDDPSQQKVSSNTSDVAASTQPADPNAGTGNATTTTSTSKADTFLTLFVAEVQNQAPTSPTDPSEYIHFTEQLTGHGAGQHGGRRDHGTDQQPSGFRQ